MKQRIILSFILALFARNNYAQVITIAEARSKALGTSVTVRGIILNGDEIGTTRYMDDGTGGLGIFSAQNSSLKRGDSIEITGTLGHFNNLLQLSSNVSFTKLDSNRALPAPIEFNTVTAGGFAKAYESRLVKINNITSINNLTGTTCGAAAGAFAGNKNYCLNNSGTTPMRVSNSANGAGDIIGKNAPSGKIAVVGIMSMFNKGAFAGGGTTTDPKYYDSTLATGFQLLVRLYEDFVLPPKPNLIDDPHPSWNNTLKLPNIRETEIEVEFNTQNLGTTKIEYGTTPAFGMLAGDSLYVKKHIVTLTGLTPASIVYVRATSTNPNGVSFSKTIVMCTRSLSSGDIKVYFNHQPDTTVATFKKGVFLDKSLDDTVVAYINRAKKTIDLAIYNINPTNLADFIKALNDAHGRGVTIRVVYDGTTANVGLNNLDPGIGTIPRNGPTGTIMHNKFMAIDAYDNDPNVPIVWGGTCNLTRAQIETDQNNMIFIQDQSLAKTYTLEFNEMFGSAGSQPDPNVSKFGASKTNNTPHDFVIGGKYIECYFSPTDGTTMEIINLFNTVNTDEYFMSMSFTRTDIATAIRNRVYAGAYGAGVVNDTTGASALVFNMLSPTNVFGPRMLLDNQSGIMHEKTGIIDPNNYTSDPLVFTGSHNWSSNAENDNDENIVVMHDPAITNLYYQSFVSLYKAITGGTPKGFVNFYSDKYTLPAFTNVTLTDLSTIKANGWNWNFGDGTSSNSGAVVTHQYSAPGTYRVSLNATNGTVSDSAVQYITVTAGNGFNKMNETHFAVFPNPACDYIYIQSDAPGTHQIYLTDLSGRIISITQIKGNTGAIALDAISKGIYIIRVVSTEGEQEYTQKVIVR